MRTIYGLILTMALCLGAWAADSTIHGLPNGTAPLPADVTIIDRESPPGTWHNYKLPLSSIATTQVITTNYYTFGTNYYYNDTYVSNYFETNILVDATSSNYFATYNYVTNTYQTNVTIEQYISNNSYVSNFVTTNIFNDTYTSNYFSTNLFPTTYVYVTNTIGGAFIANNGGEGTNTVLRGNTLITKAYGDGSGLTNLPGGSQVWTNDGTGTFLSNPTTQLRLDSFLVDDYSIYTHLYPNPDGTIVWYNRFDNTNTATYSELFTIRNFGTNADGITALMVANYQSSGDQDSQYGINGQVNGKDLDGTAGDGSAIVGDAVSTHSWQAAVVGTVNPSTGGLTSQTNIGVMAQLYDSVAGTSVGLASVATTTYRSGVPLRSSMLYVDSTRGIPLADFGTNGVVVSTLDTNGVWTAMKFVGDGSGLTNLNNVIETNVYQTFNVKNLTVQSNIFYFQSRPQVVAWSGPTNTLDFSLGQVFTYSTLVPVSITNIIGITNGYQNASLLWITNSSSTNIAITLPTGWKTGRGDATTCTNGGVFQVWPAEAGGMRTIATKEYP